MVAQPKFLITGTSSGLGQYLLEELHGVPFVRADMANELERHGKTFYDCIVHCATDARNKIVSDDLLAYYQSHIEFTEALTRIPHRLFVFISSTAVYPHPSRLNVESDIITLPEAHYSTETYPLYGLFKLLAEQIVRRNTNASLILRPTSIVGRTMRLNNIMKVLSAHHSPLTLSADSNYNLVSMSQILRFIEMALVHNITGIFNVGATRHASLADIAREVNSNPTFGNHTHNVHLIDTGKIRKVSTYFERNSLEIAREVARQLRGV